MLIELAVKSLASRRKSVLLTFMSLVISISVLISVEHIRSQAKDSFNRTIAGVDLIVGAPSGQLNLLLYSVFRMGSATSNIDYESYQKLKDDDQVEWAIPISLGDSHRGFRVLGTDENYFKHYKYGNKQSLAISQGEAFSSLFEVVIGADVAQRLKYKVGDSIIIAHGIGSTSFSKHDNTPFNISGVLAPTGTPVDKTLHVSLNAIEAIHLPLSKQNLLLKNPSVVSLKPASVTAVMLGLKSKFMTFKIQRDINNDTSDRLSAILPGVALTELWQILSTVENILTGISVLVLISSLFGLSTMLLMTMQQRRNEIAVLRVLGAGPLTLFGLVLIESLVVILLANLTALTLLSGALVYLSDWLAINYGLFLSGGLLNWQILELVFMITIAAVITAFIPAIQAYKQALNTSLSANI
ncbi:ABC transporter permease [Pseudoalteromonas lipolytica]|uniref:ABC transporter permease n=1 Tax=Pseudoalteromonas lipolytica TaxID=570156 RepID=A0ABU8SZQ1_9GAMM